MVARCKGANVKQKSHHEFMDTIEWLLTVDRGLPQPKDDDIDDSEAELLGSFDDLSITLDDDDTKRKNPSSVSTLR